MWENVWGYVGPVRDQTWDGDWVEFYLVVVTDERQFTARYLASGEELEDFPYLYNLTLVKVTHRIQTEMDKHASGLTKGFW